jgi:hypothetical protein
VWLRVFSNETQRWVSNFPKLAAKLDDWKHLDIVFEGVDDYVILKNKLGAEIGQVVKRGSDEVIEVWDDLFVSSAGGATPISGFTVETTSGEVLTGAGFVKNTDGTVGFVEDVSAYGNALIQNTIKNRGSLRGTLSGIKTGEDAHHIIPVQLLKENDVVKKAVEAGFEFNTANNGMAIEKFVKATGVGRHGPHPNYTNQIRNFLNKWKDSPANVNWTPNDAKNLLDGLVDDLKETINTTTTKINDLNLGL